MNWKTFDHRQQNTITLKNNINISITFCTLAAFLGGFAILALEMLGFRLLAPYFGYSTYVWGGLLGVIMTALSAGYYFGGKLADKKNDPALIKDLFLYSSLYLIAVLFTYKKLLSFFSWAGIIWGSVLSSVIIFGPPMILLAMVSPFVIKLLAKEGTVGITAGRISAIATIGSIMGTFVTAFALIPNVGTFMTLTIIIISLISIYIAGSFKMLRKTIAGLALIALVLLVPPEESKGDIIYKTESPYNMIMVGKKDNKTYLYLNDTRWIQSRYYEGYISTGGYYDFFLVGLWLTDLKDMLILGSAGGTSVRQFLHFAPQVKIDAVELDPKIIKVAKDYFHLPEDPQVKIHIEDGRAFLNHSQKKYDLVEVDVFSGGPYIPFYMVSREAFQLVFDKLNPGGIMLINVISTPQDVTLSNHIGNTIKSVFPSLFIVDLDGNEMLIATKDNTSLETLAAKLKNPAEQGSVIAQYTLNHLREYKFHDGFAVFTDDFSPIERITYNMLKNFDLNGGLAMND